MPGAPLLTRYMWSLSSLLGLAGLITIGVAQRALPDQAWLRGFMIEIGSAAASGGIVGFVYEHLIRRDLLDQVRRELAEIVDPDSRRLGIGAIYDSRTDKTRRVALRSLIQGAGKELMFVGVGLGPVMSEHSDDLDQAMARGCAVRFLLFDLCDGPAAVLEASLGKGDLIQNLTGSFASAMLFEQDHRPGRSFELRLFGVVPTFGAIAVDRSEGDGRIYVELNCFGSSGDQCPGFALDKRPGGLFHTYDRQISALWMSARRGAPEAGMTCAEGQPSSRPITRAV